MKKIFVSVSAVILAFVVVLLGVLTGIKKNIGFAIQEPDFLIVYNKSLQSLNGKTYEKDNEKLSDEDKKAYNDILNRLSKMTTLSLFQLATSNKNLNYKIEYDSENYATYDSTMKKENVSIEIMYKSEKNLVVYENGTPRVIPFFSLIIIIPDESKFNEIVVYSAMTNGEGREDQYKNCTPIILRGNAKELLRYIKSL